MPRTVPAPTAASRTRTAPRAACASRARTLRTTSKTCSASRATPGRPDRLPRGWRSLAELGQDPPHSLGVNEGDAGAACPGAGLLVDHRGPRLAEGVHRRLDVLHLDAHVVQALAPRRKELRDSGVRSGGTTELHPPHPVAEDGGLHLLLGYLLDLGQLE